MNLRDDKDESTSYSAIKKNASNFDYSLRYIRCIFRLLGIWALVVSRPTKMEYLFSKRILVPLVSITMTSITMPICCYVVTRPIDPLETIRLLGPITHQISDILVHLVMMLRSRLIKRCIDHMELDWKSIESSKERVIMMRYLRFSHALTVTCILFMFTGGITYSFVLPLISGNVINETNQTIRPRPFPGTEIFFDDQAYVVYEIVFLVNFISGIFHLAASVGLCVLTILFVGHTCGQIRVVISNLEDVVDRINEGKPNAPSIVQQIGLVVRKHVRLLKLAMNIEKSLKEMLLVEVFATTLVICFLEYDIFVTLNSDEIDRMGAVSYFVLYFSFSFNLFLYCQFGQVLTEHCEEIGKKAYAIDWSRFPRRTKLALVMIMNMSNNPQKLTAGGMMDLSVINFASILKTSFAYFNMLRAMG